MQEKRSLNLVVLSLMAIICFVLALNGFGIFKKAVASDAEYTINVVEKELIYNENKQMVNSGSNPDAVITHPLYVTTGTNPNMAIGGTFYVPNDYKETVSIKMETDIHKMDGWGLSRGEFRLVLNDKILFPIDGGWYDIYEGTDGKVDVAIKIMASVPEFKMSAGDKLHFMFRDPAGVSDYARYYCAYGMKIDGVWYDSVRGGISLNPTSENIATNYLGGKYKFTEILKYNEFYFSDDKEVVDFDGYEEVNVNKNQTSTTRLYQSNQFEGVEYFAFDVTNENSTSVTLSMDIYEGPNTGNYGQCWTSCEFMPYYIDFGGKIIKSYMNSTFAASEYNVGKINVPAKFSGKIYLPLTSFEQVGWQRNEAHITKFGSLETIYLGANFMDVKMSTSTGFVINSFDAIGADLASVENTANTAINLIKKIGVVSLGSENAIAKARKVYNELSDGEKNAVINIQALELAETTFSVLQNKSSIVGTHGKNFEESEGVVLNQPYSNSPSTISAWVKIDKDVSDDTHIGTVLGNNERVLRSSSCLEPSHARFSVEITTNGNPVFYWKNVRNAKFSWKLDNVDLRTGTWTNLTFTRDVDSGVVSCYVDGVLIDSINTDYVKIKDISFIKPVIIGSDYTADEILARGYNPNFKGGIADVRVYSSVLSAEEVASNLNGIINNKGVMTAVDFLSGENGRYYDKAIGVTVDDGYSFKDVSLNDMKLGDFTMAVIGDTQAQFTMCKDESGKTLYETGYDYTSNPFYKNTTWLAQNKDALNLKFAMHMGDITQNLDSSQTIPELDNRKAGAVEMDYAIQFMNELTTAGIPWSLNRGNHDIGTDNYFNEKYSFAKYGQSVSGYYDADGVENSGDENMNNTYYKIEVSGQKYLIITLDYTPNSNEIAWANSVISSNPNYRVIITTHSYLDENGELIKEAGSGEDIWNNLAKLHRNVVLVISGHATGTDIVNSVKVGDNGNTVYQIMIDATEHDYVGSKQAGLMAILGFENNGNTIHFNYYSASLAQTYRNCNNFTINLDEKEYFAESNLVSKSELDEVHAPVIQEYEYTEMVNDSQNVYKTDDKATATSYSSGDLRTNTSTIFTVAFDVPYDGIFSFGDAAFIKSYNGAWIHINVYVTDAKTGQTKRFFPIDDTGKVSPVIGNQGVCVSNRAIEYGIWGADGVLNLSTIGSLSVEKYDKIILTIRMGGVVMTCFTATMTNANGVQESFNEIQEIFNAPYADANAKVVNLFNAGYGRVENGVPVNYAGWTVGWFETPSAEPYKYKLDVVDNYGTTLISALAPSRTVLPALERSGHVFLGYNVNGVLVNGEYTLTLTADTTIVAVFAELSMFNSASIRVGENSGIKFSTYVDISVAELADLGVKNVSYGTLIAKADVITVDGKKDYSLLNLSTVGDVIDLKSTVQVVLEDCTIINGSLVGFEERQFSLEIVAKGYMTITYADDSVVTYYASVFDNGRSVKELAQKALADVSKVQSDFYNNQVDGGFSLYNADAIEVLKDFAGV